MSAGREGSPPAPVVASATPQGSDADTEAGTPIDAAIDTDALDPRIWKVCAVVLLGPVMAQMDSTVVNVSLSAAYAAVPKDQLPLATTAANIVQRIGGPIGTTALSIVVSASASVSAAGLAPAGPQAFGAAFVALVVLQTFVLGVAACLPARIQPPHAAAP